MAVTKARPSDRPTVKAQGATGGEDKAKKRTKLPSTSFVTIPMRCSYPFLTRPSTQDDNYSVTLHPDPKDEGEFKRFTLAARRFAMEVYGEKVGKTCSIPKLRTEYERDPDTGEKTTTVLSRAFQFTSLKKPVVFDASNRPVPESVMIGTGSVLRVVVELIKFAEAAERPGIKARLSQVQVIDLVKYIPQGTRSAFDAVEGGYRAAEEEGAEAHEAHGDDYSEDADDAGDEDASDFA